MLVRCFSWFDAHFLLPSDRDRTGGWSEQTAKWDNFALDAVQTSRLILFINIWLKTVPTRSSWCSSKSPCTINADVYSTNTTGHPWHARPLTVGNEKENDVYLRFIKELNRRISITIILNFQVQTKAALKGWSALTGDKTGSTPQSAGPKKVDIQYLSSVFDCIEECYHFKLVLTIFVGVN